MQQREFVLPVFNQMKPLLLMSIALVLPPGKANVKGSANGPCTWSSPNTVEFVVPVKKPVLGIAT